MLGVDDFLSQMSRGRPFCRGGSAGSQWRDIVGNSDNLHFPEQADPVVCWSINLYSLLYLALFMTAALGLLYRILDGSLNPKPVYC